MNHSNTKVQWRVYNKPAMDFGSQESPKISLVVSETTTKSQSIMIERNVDLGFQKCEPYIHIQIYEHKAQVSKHQGSWLSRKFIAHTGFKAIS